MLSNISKRLTTGRCFIYVNCIFFCSLQTVLNFAFCRGLINWTNKYIPVHCAVHFCVYRGRIIMTFAHVCGPVGPLPTDGLGGGGQSKGPVRRAVWPLRSQSGLAAAKLLLKEVTLIPT